MTPPELSRYIRKDTIPARYLLAMASRAGVSVEEILASEDERARYRDEERERIGRWKDSLRSLAGNLFRALDSGKQMSENLSALVTGDGTAAVEQLTGLDGAPPMNVNDFAKKLGDEVLRAFRQALNERFPQDGGDARGNRRPR